MDGWFVVLILSLAMLIGCYLAGCIPLAFSFSEDKLKLVTIFGAGLLVGTALAIIIPEGVNAIYEPGGHEHSVNTAHVPEIAIPAIQEKEDPSIIKRAIKEVTDVKAKEHDHHDHEHSDHTNSHKLIGVSLVTGFVFMLLVDQFGGGHSHGGSADTESQTPAHARNKVTATLGLCVHAAADGIALGAATSVSQTSLTIIVFIAIMLHKAPAAFGLVSFLLHDGMDRARIRKHLLAFSVAAPVGAIFTYFILNHRDKEALIESNATGIAMLFSAGTFLYVATVHILPEVSSKSTRSVSTDGTVIVREHKGFTKLELLCIVIGSLLPVGISLGHSH